MKILVLLTIIIFYVASQTMNCPLSKTAQSTCLTGTISVTPNTNYRNAQDVSYTNTFPSVLGQTPQIGLSLCGYQDQNSGLLQLQIDKNQIGLQSFVIRVQTPSNNKWSSLTLSYLASTKPQIQIGTTFVTSPTYDYRGFVTLYYRPTLQLTNSMKVKTYIYGINMNTKTGGFLSLNCQQASIIGSTVTILYSSNNCNINSLYLSVVLYDINTPGLVFVDGTISQNSLSSVTSNKIDGSSIQLLSIYFYGFLSINAKSNAGLSISVNFDSTFTMAISALNLNSIQVNYLVISFVQCGSCTGYPYSYSGSCYQQCPTGTNLSAGLCVPVGCGNGYQLNGNGQCVPSCGNGRVFTGKSCTCNNKLFNIGGNCGQCPPGTVYNYISQRCDPPCGTFSHYSSTNKGCSCSKGFVQIGNTCSVCPSGTTYNNVTKSCSQNSIFCGDYQVYSVTGGCQCISGYQMNTILQTCSPINNNYPSINNNNNYSPTINNNPPIINNNNYPPINTNNNYPPANNNNNFNNPMNNNNNFNNFNCGSYGFMDQTSKNCKCNSSYVWAMGGCKQPQNCATNSFWTGNTCSCGYGYVKGVNGQCQPVNKSVYCPSNSVFNGVNCQCNSGYYPIDSSGQCSQCPQNSYWTGQGCGGSNSCKQGFSWDTSKRSCNLQNTGCLINQYWDGANCRCNQGYFYINGTCLQCPSGTNFDGVQCSPISFSVGCSDPYSFYNGRSCVCIDGYYQMNNGVCITCPVQFQWTGISCNPINSNLKTYSSIGVSIQYSNSVAFQIK